MIRILKGSASAIEIAAIELALASRDIELGTESDYGKPILRTPLEVDESTSP